MAHSVAHQVVKPNILDKKHVSMSYQMANCYQNFEPRCCRSQIFYAKRTLCTTDDQCSRVGRTQSPDADVVDESVVSQFGTRPDRDPQTDHLILPMCDHFHRLFVCHIYTVSQKRRHYTLVHIFAKY